MTVTLTMGTSTCEIFDLIEGSQVPLSSSALTELNRFGKKEANEENATI